MCISNKTKYNHCIGLIINSPLPKFATHLGYQYELSNLRGRGHGCVNVKKYADISTALFHLRDFAHCAVNPKQARHARSPKPGSLSGLLPLYIFIKAPPPASPQRKKPNTLNTYKEPFKFRGGGGYPLSDSPLHFHKHPAAPEDILIWHIMVFTMRQ